MQRATVSQTTGVNKLVSDITLVRVLKRLSIIRAMNVKREVKLKAQKNNQC